MKQIQFRLFIFLLAGATLYAACRKTDREAFSLPPENKESRFFTDHASANPLVQSVNHFVKTQNEKYHFVKRMVDKIGYPIWDKVITVAGTTAASVVDDTVQLTIIPFVRDSQDRVNALLAVATTPTDTSFRIVCDWQYRDPAATGMSAKNMALTMMQLDKAVFGNRLFTITDSTLFDNKAKFVKLEEGNSNKIKTTGPASLVTYIYSYTICWTVYLDKFEGQLHGCYPGQENCNEYNEIEQCITVSWELGGGGGTGGTGGGGGGTGGTGGGSGGGGGGTGGGWVPPDPDCGEASFAGNGSTNNLLPCDPGWVPGGGGSPNANQTIIDSLQGYPCAQSVLASIASINTTTKNILATVFNLNQNVNIVFVADSTLPSNTNGYTPGSEISYVNGVFTAHVHMPPYILKNASREFIAKTMYHEAIHAYLNYMWLKFKNHEIDSITFRTLYPKIFAFKNQGEAQHDQMAATYVNNIKDIVLAFNPAISDSVNRAISWGGLTTTNAWKNLGSDTFQLNRLRSISRDSSITKMQSLNLKKCK